MRFFKGKAGKVLFCMMLGAAVIGGAPLNPEEIEELLSEMNQAKVLQEVRSEADEDEPAVRVQTPDGADFYVVKPI